MAAPFAEAFAPWATAADVDSTGCKIDGYDPPDAVLDVTLKLATDVLFNLTRRRWPGVGSDTIRPCARRRRCDRGCSCSGLSEFRLPGRPVVSITEVLLDGVVLDPSHYRLDNRRDLVWLGELSSPVARSGWPCCQDMELASTEERTWQVEYRWGSGPPAAGVTAAALLAYHMALSIDPAACEAGACLLPAGTTSVSRQGVTITVDGEMWAKGRTGLPLVDLWLGSLNYGEKQRHARVWTPGRGSRVRRTG